MKVYTREEQLQWIARLDRRFSSAAVLIENSRSELLIVKANYKSHWSLPGGIVDAGESPAEAAVREVFEEVGINISKDDLEFVALASRKSSDYMTHQFIFSIILDDEKLTNIKLQESEIESYQFIKKSEVDQFDGELLWIIPYWAKREFGYFETKIEEGSGLRKESVVFRLSII